jgi:hypothetical protein
MEDIACDIEGLRVLICAADGPPLLQESDANTFMSAAWTQQAMLVAIPPKRLNDDFFRLSTRLPREVVQKFANYRLRLAIVGDISAWTSKSKSLRDFVYESNRVRASSVVCRQPK